MSEKKKFKPLPRNYLDFGKLGLYADKLEGGERRPQFSFKVIRGFIHAVVRTGIPTDVKNGYMSLKIDPKNFYAFLGAFKSLLDKERDNVRMTIEDKIYDEKEQKFSDEMVPMGAIKAGRDKDGKIYISLVIEKRPKVQFYFGKEYNCSVKKDGGNEFTEAEYSQLYAQSYFMLLKDLIPKVLTDTSDQVFESPFVEDKKKPTMDDHTSKFDDIDDDIPF